MGNLTNNCGVTHADVDALPMLKYDDVVRCLSDEDERSSCNDLSYSETGIRLSGNTAHPAVLVLAPWTENLHTLRLTSLGTGPHPWLVHHTWWRWIWRGSLYGMGHSTVSFRMTLSDLEWLSKIFNDTKHRVTSLRQQSYLFPTGFRFPFCPFPFYPDRRSACSANPNRNPSNYSVIFYFFSD